MKLRNRGTFPLQIRGFQMRWPFDLFNDRATGDDFPISKTLKRAADILGMDVDPMTSGFLSQALIIEQIAERLVKLEREAKPS